MANDSLLYAEAQRRATELVVVGILAGLLVACGTATRQIEPRSGQRTGSANAATARAAPTHTAIGTDGMLATPGALRLPQLGSIGFRCSQSLGVQPVFDMRGAATEAVTIRAGGIARRNFTTRVIGRRGIKLRETRYSPQIQLWLPFGHYRRVVLTVRQGTEARAVTARATVEFVDRAVIRKDAPPGWACFASAGSPT